MRISKIHLKNIGVFEDETIEFREKIDPEKAEIHILTGENGTGKSTILYALAELFPKQLLGISFNNIENRMRFNDNRSGFTTTFDSDITYFAQMLDSTKNLDSNNYPDFLLNYFNTIFYISNNALNFAFFAYSGYRNVGNFQIQAIQELTTKPLENALNFNQSIQPQNIVQWIANTKSKEALALMNNDTAKAKNYHNAILRIEEVIKAIIKSSVKFILETDPLNVVIEVSGKKLPIDVLPDGLKSILSWIADLLMKMDRIKWIDDRDVFDRNFILFLDEIEVHLHPAWQRKILPEIQKLFKNAQIFISTHSPFVVGSVDGAWVYQLENKEGNSRVVKVTESRAGESYGLILDEIFGIDSEFDVETEEQFKKFYQIRDELFSGKLDREQEFLQQAEVLAKKGTEIQSIIGREIRQANRVLKKEYML